MAADPSHSNGSSGSNGGNNGGSKRQPVAFAYCEGSPSWNPDAYLADAELHARAEAHLANNDLRSAITTSFSLRKTDTYVYHAIVAVTLPQAQHVVSLGAARGLHTWYFGEPSPPSPPSPSPSSPPATTIATTKTTRTTPPAPLPPPPQPDIEAYLSIFLPSSSAPTALRNLAANAKKGSLRREIGTYLTTKRFVHPALPALVIPRVKKPKPKPPAPPLPSNPYLAFQAWASRNLEWAGPGPSSARGPASSHHALPILMHHFGCACPSHEALEILRLLADGREIIDVGSGNGYWTRMLRDYHAFHHAHAPSTSGPASTSTPVPPVTPVDSAQSSWRTTWVRDTLIADGAAYLRTTRRGAKDAVLLLVYPIVGGGVAGGSEGGFTRRMLDAYDGDTVAVVGTQNHNGYTGFRHMTMDEFMAREHGDWVKVVQVPLPSFPGKDEALYVFQRGPRAPPAHEPLDPGRKEDNTRE
ncbi:hypothetical protein F5Y14DRAFT_343741 [Nemania sp. NC0429]|nr:hypothetical protein F5Y14DRAFT_343741 [Nemania sp. NC0429]